ncbi:MAG: hypothetical protein ACI33M_08035 [Lysinibacillus sp.]
MNNVKLTDRHLENIKKHKRLFEKWDLWDYSYKENNKHYYVVSYEMPIKGVTGYLFLNENGEELPYNEAVKYGIPIMNFNTIMDELIKKTLPQMYKDTTPYKQLLTLLTDYEQAFLKVDGSVKDSINRIIIGTKETLQMNPKLEEIYYEIGYMQREVTREKGYLDKDLLMRINDKMLDIRTILYSFGVREIGLNADYNFVLNIMKDNKIEMPRLKYLGLKSNIRAAIDSNNTTLKKSMRKFETDFEGNEVYIDPNDIKGSLKRKTEASIGKEFEESIVPLIRNRR